MLIHKQKLIKNLKEKVLNNAGDLFNDLQYIYKDKYNEEINRLDTGDRIKFDYKNLRLTEDYLYLSEKEQEEASEKPTRTDLDELNKQIIREETEISEKLFKIFF